jgi:hypothetical protein
LSLIDNLIADQKPKPPIKVMKVMIPWLITAFLIAFYILWRIGLRPDFSSKLYEWQFLLGLLFYGILFISASVLAVGLAIPGRVTLSSSKVYWGLSGVFFLALVFYGSLVQGPSWHVDSLEALACCLRISYGAVIPSLLLIVILARITPLNAKAMGLMIWVSCVALISIVSQLNCPIDDFFHIFVGHGVMLLALGIFAALACGFLVGLIGRSIYDRRKSRIVRRSLRL